MDIPPRQTANQQKPRQTHKTAPSCPEKRPPWRYTSSNTFPRGEIRIYRREVGDYRLELDLSEQWDADMQLCAINAGWGMDPWE